MIANLSDILEPVTSEEFFSSCLGNGFRYLQGRPGKFAELLPWSLLNEILCRYRFDFPRIHLIQNHKVIPSESFMQYSLTRRDTRVLSPLLQATAFSDLLRQGATLVVDNVEEVCEPIRDLSAELERTFQERVMVNTYVTFRESNALDVHWDDHDVLILQVAGKKRWSLYGATRPYPLRPDIKANTQPTQEPIWEGMVEDGDLLYMPRGCWHRANSTGEPSLHLSVGIYNSTGVDFLTWLTKQLRESELIRKDVPRFASEVEQDEYVTRLREELLAQFDSDVLHRFFRYSNGVAEPHPELSLPWSVMPEAVPPSDNAFVHLTLTRPLEIDTESSERAIVFFANGKRWKFPAATLVILKALDNGSVCSITELCDLAGEILDRQKVRQFLGQLSTHGLVAFSETRDR